MTIGATLGGAMVYRMGVMINRNAYRNGPADFQPAIAASKLAEGQMVRVHGPFVSDDVVEKVVAHLKLQGSPEYLDAITEDDSQEDGDDAPREEPRDEFVDGRPEDGRRPQDGHDGARGLVPEAGELRLRLDLVGEVGLRGRGAQRMPLREVVRVRRIYATNDCAQRRDQRRGRYAVPESERVL